MAKCGCMKIFARVKEEWVDVHVWSVLAVYMHFCFSKLNGSLMVKKYKTVAYVLRNVLSNDFQTKPPKMLVVGLLLECRKQCGAISTDL